MYRTHTCGELRIAHAGSTVTLAGWAARIRNLGSMAFIDLRDRYGITQIAFNENVGMDLLSMVAGVGREYVLQVKGKVAERAARNPNLPTGDVELIVEEFTVLNPSLTPPFTIENETDGGDDIRMQYRYLDLRREPVRNNLILRHKLAQSVRNFLSNAGFLEVETPVLIKSTPEGARDFVVPSRMNPGQWYALPQSPQTFKQLLMVSGFDKYFQIVKCFRDEDLRADRQPEFTQIDCEMSFVEQEDILQTFEGMMKQLFREVKGIEFGDFERMTYQDAMRRFGSDKPDMRFGMEFCDLTDLAQGKGFGVFDSAESVIGICAPSAAGFSRKQLDELTEYVKRPQIGAKGMVYCRFEEGMPPKSSVDKFYTPEQLAEWGARCNVKPGDLLLVLSGNLHSTRKQMNELRLHMGNLLGLRDPNVFKPMWVVDFPLLEFDENGQRWHAMHHPFTSPLPTDLAAMESDPGSVRANAYDLVINGVEIGGGSIRIHDRALQSRMFQLLGFTEEQAKSQFGFLLSAFEYGAPPHGGIALGFDRLCSLFGGSDSIRDFIAFPKNNAGRDVMIDAPSAIDASQLSELGLK
ncbi:MAG: aspartate--tRNA ligase [Bacteroidetes bacterium]|nr:aspartate--tRNA ligase [Bacteroidota bacterium]